jgi:outer membrane protein assembly factor BamE
MFKSTLQALCVLASLTLAGCTLDYHPDIQQGNMITAKQVGQLHKGMAKSEVSAIMGSPILANTFDTQHLNYVYTYQKPGKPMKQRRVIVTLQHGKVSHIEKNIKAPIHVNKAAIQKSLEQPQAGLGKHTATRARPR